MEPVVMDEDQQLAGKRGDRLRQLRAFCHTARLESMTRAAEYLRSSQPSVSQQVRALERELSLDLFERRGVRIALTPAGRRLYRLALPVVTGMDRLPDAFADRYHVSDSGELVIAAGQSTAAFVLPGYLERFRERHPRTRVQVRCGGGRERMEWLRAWEVDVALGAMDVPPPDLLYRHICYSSHVLITPEDHPMAEHDSFEVRDFASHPLVLPRAGFYARQMMDTHMRLHGFVPEVAAEVDGWNAVKRYVEAGVGICVVPEVCLTARDRVRRIPIDHLLPRMSFGMLVRRDRDGALDRTGLTTAAKHFIELLAPDSPAAAEAA